MDHSVILPVELTERWDLARQMGLTTAVTRFPETDDETDPWAFEPLLHMNERFSDAGFDVDVLEVWPPLDDVILGRDGRDEQIDSVQTMLRNMGRVGINIWCYAWMAPLTVLRTSNSVRGRGGSLVTRYEHAKMERGPDLVGVNQTELWENYEYFLDKVIPVAEQADVKLALHPDDPPISSVRGVDRIMTSVENFDRALALNDSRHHGITFCQGNFTAMGVDVPEAISHFGERIHFAHFRDVDGTADSFTEVWQDEGPTDMGAAIRAYDAIGFDGPIRPDHTPTMAGEPNDTPGYQDKGRLFAIGYMKGLFDQYRSMQDVV
ncbi:mannonate dehydratase [Halovenus marina]|uniref:mannonate dehydratase n=1 Tax=Halovenus marina TaxID=3396621 RepID=UPI003F57B698